LKVKVCGFYSPEREDLLGLTLENAEDFGVGFEFDVCSADDEPGTLGLFTATICTPKWLDRSVTVDELRLGRHLFIVKRWEPQRVMDYITDFVARIEAETWPELAEIIGRIAWWEEELPAYMDWESY
jgi:hypothetical protein